MKNVLVLTYEEDQHADYACRFFEENKIEFFRVNTDKLIGDYIITYDSNFGYYSLSNDIKRISLDGKWNIWNRRIAEPEIPATVPRDLTEVVATETARTWEGLLFVHEGRVINRPQANFSANNKIDQLSFVKKYGGEIKIPETILTNDPQVLRNFYKEKERVCHKLQKAALVKRGDQCLTTYTNLVSQENLELADLVEVHPNLFQTYMPKKYELRVTAMRNKVIGIAIFSQNSEKSKIDFRRYDFQNVAYERVDLPESMTTFCKNMLEHYGLFFGEFDFILTPAREYVFLELNPNGQWLWLQLQSGYNLTKDIALELTL